VGSPVHEVFGFEWVEKYFEVAPGICGVLRYAFAAVTNHLAACCLSEMASSFIKTVPTVMAPD
jgi:hypothetical protein